MPATRLAAADLGLPHHTPTPAPGGVFSLGCHSRAKDALDFGLSARTPGFNIFVVGGDRSGRMTETLHYLNEEMAKRQPPPDWVYLNNFRRPHRPRPCRLTAGTGRKFRDAVAALIPNIRTALQQAFEDEAHQTALQAPAQRLQEEVNRQIAAVKADAESRGLTIVQTQSGPAVTPAQPEEGDEPKALTQEEMEQVQADARAIAERLSQITRWASVQQKQVAEHARQITTQIADEAIHGLIGEVATEFAGHGGLQRWLEEMRIDILDNIQRFATRQPEGQPPLEPPELRYAINLFVDHSDDPHPLVVLEPNPTYDNLFGRFEYRQAGMRLETDFTLLRAGALHRANGGIIVLRAEALAAQPVSWLFLKGALRDREIQLEDLRQQAALPIAGAPRPKPIPLDVKVVLVGAPQWFQTFFAADVDFQTHFRIKAEIDNDVPADETNLAYYAGLLETIAERRGATGCEPAAITRLLAYASRLAEDRTRLSAKFELLDDVIAEARVGAPHGPLTAEAVDRAISQRRVRNARTEDLMHERISDGSILIETEGAVTGQVNGLTIRDVGDHVFGAPARVTARASAGRDGIVNIERFVAMGGPIQQKGAMILQGFLAARFARTIPMSFSSSITFEQSYGGVEGDSASLAEAVAVISDLADLPVRQDLAITGSMNQHGFAQVVGGVARKVEGFYRACLDKPNGLTGSQGVIVPAGNARNLVLRADVTEAIAAGRFHVWTINHIDEALELLLATPVGQADADGSYPADSVSGRVMARLAAFNAAIAETYRKGGA